MNTANDDPLRILSFWRDLEIFNIPNAPSAREANDPTRMSTPRRGDALPWQLADFAPTETHTHIHVVYVGVADAEDLTRLLLRGLFPGRELSERECQRLSGSGWLAAFVVDERGQPRPGSYLPASFAHGVAALRETQALDRLNARLERAKEAFDQRRPPCADAPESDAGDGEEDASDGEDEASHAAHEAGDAPPPRPLDWDALDEELLIARRPLGEAADDPGLDWRVRIRSSRVQWRFLEEQLSTAVDFLNSFYLDDLDRLIALAEKKQAFGQALRAYLGPALEEGRRIDLLANDDALSERVDPQRLPSARWPASSAHPLVLAQQAAVSEAIHSLARAPGLIGINGPPGTGKTTLLCDVIAEVVTDRARRIAALDRPAALFGEKREVAGKGFFPVKAEIMGESAIVVASTNNNAVKNISQALPAQTKIAEEFQPVDYFAEVMREVFRAQKVTQEVEDEHGKKQKQPVEPWGVIAAALGNAGNRRSFARGFFRDESRPARDEQGEPDEENGENTPSAGDAPPPSMKQVLEAATSNDEYARHQQEWEEARQVFLGLQAEFERCRAMLARAGIAARRMGEAAARRARLDAEEEALREDIAARAQEIVDLREKQANQRAVVDGYRAVVTQRRESAPSGLWDRVLAWLGRESPRQAAWRQSLQAPARALAEAAAALDEMNQEAAAVHNGLKQQEARLQALSAERARLAREGEADRSALQAAQAMGATHFPDAGFWAMPLDARHRASLAVSPALDKLRARLFLQAVELHRLSILANAGKFIANLRAVNGMLTGGLREKLLPEHRPALWDAFFFVVPVVSTTLASFDRLFAGMGQASLGWLLIDEAGQATPPSAAGAIWRSRRAIIVGDPLQIEPVFTVPHALAEALRQRHGVSARWSPIDESVQTLADRVTPFGAWVEAGGARQWTGMPLRTHRRCDEPMFSVANRIAYDGQMVQGRVDAAGRPAPWEFACALGESAWYDVRSSRVKHPVSEDELDCLVDCLKALQPERDGKTQVYVISPFRKLAQACQKRARACGVECGTVHTFQGKEAEIVFLVLGAAPGQAGSGARNWAASRPNLLNVAVTRAKCRLYVIGDASQWGELDYFRELRRALPVRPTEAAPATRSPKP